MVNRYFRKMKILIIRRKILSQNSSTQLKVNGLPGDKANTSTNTKEIDDPATNPRAMEERGTETTRKKIKPKYKHNLK